MGKESITDTYRNLDKRRKQMIPKRVLRKLTHWVGSWFRVLYIYWLLFWKGIQNK